MRVCGCVVRRALFRGNTLAPGCIAVLVRHGDKGGEAPVYSNEQYFKSTQAALDANDLLKKQVSLFTDDNTTVTYYINTAQQGWQTTYTDMPLINGTNALQWIERTGRANAMFLYLLNIDQLLACDAFVAPINSNMARMVDELRSASRCKAEAVFVDPEQGGQYVVDEHHWL